MESISRLSGILESARELTLDAAREVRRNPTEPMTTAQLKKLLDSRHEAEVLDGLRRVIALTSRPSALNEPPVLFSAVLKNIASPSLPVKKLVYLYLVQHAESEPDTALLAINTIQKALSAPDAQLRALALRVMSSIKVPVISQIVALGIKRGCADMSPLVRRAAALAIPKCRKLDPNLEPQLLDYLGQLLGDRQYYVAGAAVLSFMDMCPDRIDLIHKHYRSLARKLVDMDEWGQLATLRLMTVYARLCFPQKMYESRENTSDKHSKQTSSEHANNIEDFSAVEDVLDPDLSLLLRAAQPLLQSRNSAVLMAVTRLYLCVAPENSSYILSTVGPLISLLRSAPSSQEIALQSIVQVALSMPEPFARYASRFLVHASDAPAVRVLKLELLTLIFPYCSPHTRSLVLAELSHFATSATTSSNDGSCLAREAVRAIGRCAQSSVSYPNDDISSRCLQLLLSLISAGEGTNNADLVAEALTVIRHLIQANPAAHVSTVTRLAKSLDIMTSPRARASTIWLIGEFSGMENNSGGNIAADVLRILARGFADEAVEAKLQIVLLAAKTQVHNLSAHQTSGIGNGRITDATAKHDLAEDFAEEPQRVVADNRISQLYDYVLLLARYDTSYDLRDRARVYRSLLSSPTATQLATLILLAPKPVPQAQSPSETSRGFMLGSASSFVGADVAGSSGLPGYKAIPNWVKAGEEPDARLRSEGDGDNVPGVVGGSVGVPLRNAIQYHNEGNDSKMSGQDRGIDHASAPAKEKTLDDWLAEEDGDQSDEESESEGEETESEETTSSPDEDDEGSEETESDEDNDERIRLVQ